MNGQARASSPLERARMIKADWEASFIVYSSAELHHADSTSVFHFGKSPKLFLPETFRDESSYVQRRYDEEAG